MDDVLFSIRECLEKHSTCRIGLAGGTTPEKLYKKLSQEKLPWESLVFIVLDERYVPSDHVESNLRMIRSSLFNRLPHQPKGIIAFDTSLPRDSAAKEMDRKLKKLERERKPIFDLLILGAGKDGHIASLFDGDAAQKSEEFASPAHARGYPTPERLTVTSAALAQSERALLLLKGTEKIRVKERLEQRKNKAIQKLPFTAMENLISRIPFNVHYFA